MEAYKLEILVIDHDQLGGDEISRVIENTKYPNWCISPSVKKITGKDIGAWHDDHPLNKPITCTQEYNRLFSGEQMESKLKQQCQDSVGELHNLLLLEGGYPHLPTTPIKQEPELTDWISGDILPTIDGVYQRDYFSHYKKKTIGYSIFKNGKWHGGVRTSEYGAIDRASNVGKVSTIQNLPWRGLAKNPEVQP